MAKIMFDFFLLYLHYPDLFAMFIKLFGIVLSFLYVLYAFVMVKQVEVLIKTIQVHDNGVLKLATLVQLILSLILLAYGILIL